MSGETFDWFAVCESGEIKPENALVACSEGDDCYVPFNEDNCARGAKKFYVPTLDLPDNIIDKLIDYTLDNKASLIVQCGETLTEVGIIDARFGRSPVMQLYEFGLLDYSTVVSGVYLDKDDLSLMAQEGTPLVVLPTYNAGRGNGIAPVKAAYNCGVDLRIGSGNGAYNRSRNMIYEAAFLRLAVSATLNLQDAVPLEYLAKACLPESAEGDKIQRIAKLIKDF